jgi:uncharacterized protein YccT (UPF0319 family)
MGFANLLAESAEIDIRGPEGSKSEKGLRDNSTYVHRHEGPHSLMGRVSMGLGMKEVGKFEVVVML